MKIILTGITGNLGHEVALDLLNRKIDIIPILRDGRKQNIILTKNGISTTLESNLEDNSRILFNGQADCIVHCAGNVHFQKAKNANEMMMTKLIKLAKELQVPLYFVSTAFIYRPSMGMTFNNSYESDKYNAEQVLINSGVRHAIFKPSVLVGNSKNGEVQNFGGYYSLVKALLRGVNDSKRKNKKLKIPKFPGYSNIIPVDQAAKYICDMIQKKELKEIYITNPKPPKASWVLDETVSFFKLKDSLDVLNCTYEEFGELELTDEEKTFYRFSGHFEPYWSIEYNFPNSVCKENLINHRYMMKMLNFFQRSDYLSHE